MKTKDIIHFLSLSGVGGVQQQFLYFYNIAKQSKNFNHMVYSPTNVEQSFYELKHYKTDSFLNRLWLIHKFISKDYIVHYYNNLGSKGLNKILTKFPSNHIILHEHGTVWNANDSEKKIYQENIFSSSIVLANSNATKIMIHKKFDIPLKKIKVLYNGIPIVDIKKKERSDKTKIIGYIGRLDSHKGVHTLIESAKKIKDKNIIFKIAGSGNVEKYLKELANECNSIEFIGRVKNPYEFISSLDILVVPSIREPLGNVVLEAGLCRIPVIASGVDGIPEIIEHNVDGILLEPKNKISLDLDNNSLKTFPKVVVDPKINSLVTPREISSDELADSILELLKDEQKSNFLSNNLYKKVVENFSIDRFVKNLEEIYSELYNNTSF